MNDNLCAICGRAMDRNRASCNQCGAEFHLALRTDVEMQDCGDAWIDDDVQALVFGCNRCLGRLPLPAASGKRYARRAGSSAREVARSRTRPGRG
jgi:hypothetical protein